ncbi:MAG: hypothetical protein Q8K86_11650 [Candidatus Nanopelagicaceae bacterium]|nr:hypothetical protein [Candidatus Nanopelagicaceae bacterium]
MNVIELVLFLDAVKRGESKQIPVTEYQRWFLGQLAHRGFGDGGTLSECYDFVEELFKRSDYGEQDVVKLIKRFLEETK